MSRGRAVSALNAFLFLWGCGVSLLLFVLYLPRVPTLPEFRGYTSLFNVQLVASCYCSCEGILWITKKKKKNNQCLVKCSQVPTPLCSSRADCAGTSCAAAISNPSRSIGSTTSSSSSSDVPWWGIVLFVLVFLLMCCFGFAAFVHWWRHCRNSS